MKNLRNLIQGTKEKLQRGAREAVIGSCVVLGALAGGSCTPVPPTPEVVVCSYYEDTNNDGLNYPTDYKQIRNDFDRDERVTIVYTNPKPGCKITAIVYNENKVEVDRIKSIASKGKGASFEWEENSIPKGVYEVRIFSDDTQIQTVYFSVQ